MLRGAALAAVALAIAGCGVRAPSRIDTAALVARVGPVEARRTLELRLIRDPADLAARLALAALHEQHGRPTAAIEQLEAVITIGGPLGTRWRADDRARLARLLAARGRARLARSSPTALAELEHAQRLGAPITARELAFARLARALAQLRHVDAAQRAAGHAALRALASTPAADPAWSQPGPYAVWLWQHGARRAAWEALATSRASADPAIHAAYLVARAWWTPHDAAPPPAADLTGPERCRFAHAPRCDARSVLDEPAAIPGLLAGPIAPTSDPLEAAAWRELTLVQALRGEAAWGPAYVARVAPGTPIAPPRPLVAAAELALAGATPDQLRAALGALADTPDGRALLRIVEPAPAAPASHADAVVAFVRARVPAGPSAETLRPLVVAYARDPAITDRLALDVIAAAPDAAVAHAALGALFEAVEDPARSRAAWHAAVDASPEPALVRGLALAVARTRDPDAALVHATTAAAASGDPGPVWTAIARALHGVGADVHAVEAARYAIELSGRDALAPALEVAAAASRALGRTAQADELLARRAALAPLPSPRDDDPTDPLAALAAPSPARLWIASRWNPRAVAPRAALRTALPPDDPRRLTIDAELVALAADPDPDVGRAAVSALR